jgi:hypothetical protein
MGCDAVVAAWRIAGVGSGAGKRRRKRSRVAVEEEERAESEYGNVVHGFSLLQACTSDVVVLYVCIGSHAALSIRHRSAMKTTEDFGFRF